MKPIIIIALIILSNTGCTNNHRRTRTERVNDDNTSMKIEDDGETMSIKLKTKNTGSQIDYDKSFDVRNMNEKQIEKLKKHILDSLYKTQ